MLYYAGVTKKVGDVDKGNTQTDYMSQEMERGITIQSAAVSLYWKEHAINLIDTPGHVDFGIEVERSLRVVDGVVALFDAAVGVQAQSFTVLKQAENFDIPTIAFMNKMDKTNASFFKAVETIRVKLGKEPLLLEIPLFGDDGSFEGTIDVIRSVALRYGGKNGEVVNETKIQDENSYIQEICAKHRRALFGQLSARDDALAEQLIEALEVTDGDEVAAEDSIPISEVKAAVRRQTLAQPLIHRALKDRDTAESGTILPPLIPTLCGASRRDVGVQPLLNAINDYLPAPTDRQQTLLGSEGITVCSPLLTQLLLGNLSKDL
jgi:elongation factor G